MQYDVTRMHNIECKLFAKIVKDFSNIYIIANMESFLYSYYYLFFHIKCVLRNDYNANPKT